MFHLQIYAFVDIRHSFEAKDGEDDYTSIDGRYSITDGHEDDISDAVILRWIIASEGN